MVVSIHAPGRGATTSALPLASDFVKFQFTHPGGVRHAIAKELARQAKFQFTHPGGVRLDRTIADTIESMFQFTHPGGVRQYGAKLRIMGRINKRNLRLEVLL